MRRVAVFLIPVLTAVFAAGCGAGVGESDSGGKVRASATISVIQDLVRRVGGDRVEVSTIVPVGGSPETFQPTPRDVGRISEADVVFENGLGLDHWVEDLVESAGGEDQKIVELSEGLEPLGTHEHGKEGGGGRGPEKEHAEGNPHLWMDVENTRAYVEKIRDSLVEVDPEGAGQYRANAEEYLSELKRLDSYIEEQTGSIPENRRKLVTFHDSFPYFAEAYGFEQVAVVLQSPDAEPGGRHVAGVVRRIEEENVPAVFAEPQFNPGLADTIAQEAGVEVYELYSDTLSDDKDAATYKKMMRTNIDRITQVLG